jgi:subtilisin-like proprotein convertase family protein
MRRLLVPLVISLLALAMAPLARADTHTFLDTDVIYPAEPIGIFGPANHFPATIEVEGVPGPVTNATVTLIQLGSGSGDDIDMALESPDGTQVMLMSDACGVDENLEDEVWTFDDAAPTFLSDNGPCTSGEHKSYKPTNYEPESDDFGPDGPEGPFLNHLSAFDGSGAEGEWNLYVNDDNDEFFGYEFDGWALTLETEPPAPPAPEVITKIVPQTTVVTVPAPAAPSATNTGKRAAALAKCKKKHDAKAKRSCVTKAKKLPA